MPRPVPSTSPSRRLLALTVALAALLAWQLGPAQADQKAGQKAGQSADQAADHKSKQAARPDRHQALLAKADAIAAEVAQIRGLAQKRPIKRGVMQKHEIEKRLLERIDDEYSPEELAAEELAMKRMGLIPRDLDYKQLVIDLLTDQIAGFYDPIERHLYIAGWQQSGFGAAGDDMVLAHEILHALQDQHFDLRAFMKPDKHNGDASVARQALVEGDGTALMLEHMLSRMSLPLPWHQPDLIDMMGPQMSAAMAGGELAKAPLVLRESLVFPYLGGLAFIAHFRKNHPWRRIDAIYRKPPLSTEHILHPEAYERYERPVRIKVASLPVLRGHDVTYRDVLGEMGLTLFLRQHIIEGGARAGARKGLDDDTRAALRQKSEQAAAGWGGDRLAVYTSPGHDGGVRGAIAVLYTTWDETADALEFFDALSDAMPSLAGGGTAVRAEGDQMAYRDSAGDMYLAERKRDAVVVVVGASQAQAPAVLQQVWKRWRVQRR